MAKKRNYARIDQYNRENYKKITIRFNFGSDADILEHLKTKRSITGYIRRLILADMAIEEALERERLINGFDFR